MQSTITCGKHLAEHANISGSRFHDVNLSGADFNDVNLGKAKFHNINLSDIQVSAANLSGAKFKHIGPPPDQDGMQARQRPGHVRGSYALRQHFPKRGYVGRQNHQLQP
jgi:hypothetical protein